MTNKKGASDEPLEGEILPRKSRDETDLEMMASPGHVIFAQMANAVHIGRFFVPSLALATTALIGVAFSGVPDLRPILGYKPVEIASQPQRSALGNAVWKGIGFDPATAVTLPDGQKVHARLAWMTRLPPARAGTLDAGGFRALVDEYRSTLVISAEEHEREQAEEHAARLEASSEWNTEAWTIRYKLAVADQDTDQFSISTVSAQGFWQNEQALDLMASTGVVATTEQPDTFYAAAYIDGTPSVSVFDGSGCYTVLGISYGDNCQTVSGLSEGQLELARETLWGDAVDQTETEDLETPPAQLSWYLDFPLTAGASVLTEGDFENLYKVVDADLTSPDGTNWHTSNLTALAWLPSTPMVTEAKGLLKDPHAIEAMRGGGVIGTTSVPGQVVVAAYVDGEARIRVRNQGGLCVTVLGQPGYGCGFRDIADDGSVSLEETVAATVRSLYEEPEADGQVPVPYGIGANAEVNGESTIDRNAQFEAFNAVLQDVAEFGTSREGIGKWTRTPEVDHPVLLARPQGFFLKDANVEALATGGAVIVPEDRDNTYLLATRVDGKLNLQLVEIGSRNFTCFTVIGEPGDPVRNCGSRDLSRYSDLIRSLFEE